MLHKIRSVTPLPGYALLVHFADGCARQYNMAPLLDQIDAFARALVLCSSLPPS